MLAPESSPADMRAFRSGSACRRHRLRLERERDRDAAAPRAAPRCARACRCPGSTSPSSIPTTAEECPRARFDDDGRLLNADEAIGEIVGRNAAATASRATTTTPRPTPSAPRNGWYWSGDLAYRDDDGVFCFAGRAGDWLRVDGENFAAAPGRAHPRAVRPASPGSPCTPCPTSARSRPGDGRDRARAAAPRSIPAAFDAFLAEQPDLGTKWAPRYVRVVKELPVGATGKVDTARLRRERWMVSDELYWRPQHKAPLEPMTSAAIEELHRRFDANGRADALR